MGYDTIFEGSFSLNRPLDPEHKEYLQAFSESRHVKYNDDIVSQPDPIREKVGLPIGTEGSYFVGPSTKMTDSLTRDYNRPPKDQPGLYCQWIPSKDGTKIVWDEGEKFYNYIEWIRYLIQHFLKPWNYVLNGEVIWKGESHSDRGIINIDDNVITIERCVGNICDTDDY